MTESPLALRQFKTDRGDFVWADLWHSPDDGGYFWQRHDDDRTTRIIARRVDALDVDLTAVGWHA